MGLYFYAPKQLPEGFRFPQAFLDFVAQEPIPDVMPWWFVCTMEQTLADFWLAEIRRQYPSRALVPFAKYDTSDDVACFDARTPADDPVVHIVHTFASSGWEDRGQFANFAAWLAMEREA